MLYGSPLESWQSRDPLRWPLALLALNLLLLLALGLTLPNSLREFLSSVLKTVGVSL
jgi:hypothetical protein